MVSQLQTLDAAIKSTVNIDALRYSKKAKIASTLWLGFVKTTVLPPKLWMALDPIIAGTPMYRLGTPEELTFAAVLMGSDKASYITGCTVNTDGGYTAQ